MIAQHQLKQIDKLILETPIVKKRVPYRGELEDEIEVDDAPSTLRAAAQRLREYLTPLNQGDGMMGRDEGLSSDDQRRTTKDSS